MKNSGNSDGSRSVKPAASANEVAAAVWAASQMSDDPALNRTRVCELGAVTRRWRSIERPADCEAIEDGAQFACEYRLTLDAETVIHVVETEVWHLPGGRRFDEPADEYQLRLLEGIQPTTECTVAGLPAGAFARWNRLLWRLAVAIIDVGREAPAVLNIASHEFRQYLRGYLALTRGAARHGRATAQTRADRAWAAGILNSHYSAEGFGLPFLAEEIALFWPHLCEAFTRAGHKPSMAAATHNVAEDGAAFSSRPHRTEPD